MFDDDLPTRKPDTLGALQKEDLDPFSVEQLDQRIAALEAEIARTKADRDRKTSHRSAAEALFKK
ncbi:MAG: DUF1192 domain-containing protein [Sphingomonadales bacterium]